jgi:hypothetical protein
VRLNPEMTFVFVSGAGADSSERGRLMWARVKGQTENALLTLPFRRVLVFRPGVVLPAHGVRSRTAWVRAAYTVTRPLWGLFALFPQVATTSERIGLAMLEGARHGAPTPILETRDINALASRGTRG